MRTNRCVPHFLTQALASRGARSRDQPKKKKERKKERKRKRSDGAQWIRRRVHSSASAEEPDRHTERCFGKKKTEIASDLISIRSRYVNSPLFDLKPALERRWSRDDQQPISRRLQFAVPPPPLSAWNVIRSIKFRFNEYTWFNMAIIKCMGNLFVDFSRWQEMLTRVGRSLHRWQRRIIRQIKYQVVDH